MNLEKLKQIKLKGGDKKIMKTKIKNEKGITLIALVVTIVVLLILAGVSINAVFSDNGIIKRAQEAQNKMDEAQQNDLDAINGLNEWIDSMSNTNKSTITPTKTKLGMPTLTYISSNHQINLSKVVNVDHYDFYNGSTKLCTIDANGDAVGTPELTTMDVNGEYFIIALTDSTGNTRLNADAIPNTASIKVKAVPASNSEQYLESDFSNVVEFNWSASRQQ